MVRPGFQGSAAGGWLQSHRNARPCQPRRRPSRRGREHAAAAQHDRVHAVLLLPLGNARAAAGLVKGRALPFARGEGPPRRARRFRRHAAEGHGNPGLGFHRRDALPGAADATRGHRWLERGAACRTRHARFHDRDRLCQDAGSAVVNGVHDMGGMDGFGKVEAEPNEPVFHAAWESRVLAMVRAMGAAGAFNIDTSRFYRETLPPHVYLSSSYYKKWLLGLEDMLLAKGIIAKEDI